MPFRAERYPPDWPAISLAARERAGWRCEFCGAVNGMPNPETGSIVVLTVAHMDHNPENCAFGNLRALCQACHLRYDARFHAVNAAETRRERKREAGQMELDL
jgi:hypothetical protein